MYKTVDAFRPHFIALARAGYFEIDLDVFKRVPPVTRKLHDFYRMFVWLLVVMYNVQHVIRVIQCRHSTGSVVNTLFILLTTLNTAGKQVAFNARAGRVRHVISVVDGEYFAPRNAFHEGVLNTNAMAMSRLLTLYHSAIFICGGLWTIFPIVNRALGYEVEFTAYIPCDSKDTPCFELALTYMSLLIVLQAYGNVTMDCTIVALYAQAKTQLEMLKYDLEHINDADLDINWDERGLIANRCYYYKDAGCSRSRHLKERLIRCVKRYEQIVWFVKEVESIFGEAMVIQFIVMAWVICMTMYKIIGLRVLSAEFFSMAVYLGCMLAQLFIYCYYGTQLKVQSESITEAVYSSDWVSLSPRFRCSLLVVMGRSRRAVAPRVASIVPMSLETYIAVLRFSYTLFTFLDRS